MKHLVVQILSWLLLLNEYMRAGAAGREILYNEMFVWDQCIVYEKLIRLQCRNLSFFV